METEYLKFEPSKVISIRMLNRSSVFKEFVGTWNYFSLAESSCVLRITHEYSLRFPFGLVKGLVSNKVSRNISNKLTFLKVYLDENQS
jgi:ribosome-associated toxin RatA of RatAB toxin-antitoxin module